MSLDVADRRTLRTAMRPILIEARDEDARENPAGARHPFFRPVGIALEGNRRLSAFSRDLSPHGIGLMHAFPLPLEEVGISIATARGYHVKVRTLIMWCKPCGEGFYLSGGHFLSVPEIGEA